MKRSTFDDSRDDAGVPDEAPQRTYQCPARGCPNAATVSLDHGARWACYFHAKAPPENWTAATQRVQQGWPATANWNDPAKIAHEAEQAVKRRAKLPQRSVAGFNFGSALEIGEPAW